jgi:biopolymer transport protein ExbD
MKFRSTGNFLGCRVKTMKANWIKILHIFGYIFLLSVVGCSKHKTQPVQSQLLPPAMQRIAVSEWDKVKIDRSGEIFVNKKQVSLTEFAAECQRLKKVGGAAVVYCPGDSHNPSTTGTDFVSLLTSAQGEVIHKLADAGVPIKVAQKESDLD